VCVEKKGGKGGPKGMRSEERSEVREGGSEFGRWKTSIEKE